MEGNGELMKGREMLREGHCVSSVDQSSFWHRESLQQPLGEVGNRKGQKRGRQWDKKKL